MDIQADTTPRNATPQPPPVVERGEDDWKKLSLDLWMLLDDIDTTSDIVKGNDAAFRSRVESIQARRHALLHSDDPAWMGYEAPDYGGSSH